MKIQSLDHLVLTTQNLAACLHFYVDILGMEHRVKNAHHAVCFGRQKLNIHTRPAEFLPAAAYPSPGSLDLCLVVDATIEDIRQEILAQGYPLEMNIVHRNGACGPMQSIYLRDPDGNLVELCSYRETKQTKE